MKLRRETRLPSRFRDDELSEPIRCRSTSSDPSTHASPLPTTPPVQRDRDEMLSLVPWPTYDENEQLDGDVEREVEEWPGLVEWDDLTDGMRIVVLAELSRALSFRRALDYLSLTSEQRDELIRVCRYEAILSHHEHKRMWIANTRQMELLGRGIRDSESRHDIMEEEVYSKNVEPVMFTITNEQISKAKKFLDEFRIRERYELLDLRNRKTMLEFVIDYNRWVAILPTRAQLLSIKENLDTYLGSGTCWYMLGLDEEVDWDVEVRKFRFDGTPIRTSDMRGGEQSPRRPPSNTEPGDFSMRNGRSPDKKKDEKHKTQRRKMRPAKAEDQIQHIGHAKSPDPKHTPRIPSTLRNFIVVEDMNATSSAATGDKNMPDKYFSASSATQNNVEESTSSTLGTLKRKLSSLGRNPFQ